MTDRATPPVVMLTGANGQLGWELQRRATQEHFRLHAFERLALDITDAAAVNAMFDSVRADIIINAAAYTAVDRAEEEPERAYAINCDGAANLARAAHRHGATLIHVSTDFVFDGANGAPYKTDDEPRPQGVYGASKLAGETAVREIMLDKALIIRAAWVYSAHGSNFVKTILRLMENRDDLRVVDDQIGSPTWASGLANCIWQAFNRQLTGVYHWTDAGAASWYDFAVAIQEEALHLNILTKKIPLMPIPTFEYPTLAARPSYSVLDKSTTWRALNHAATHWRVALRHMLNELAHA
jgi:dTDP-4-dehydrorhamnose reductase